MNFEKAFDEFIGNNEYDKAEAAVFLVVREAFEAGWAAGEKNRGKNHQMIDFAKSEFAKRK